MSEFEDSGLPPELADVAETLRQRRADPSALQLDSIKRRAMAAAAYAPRKGPRMKSKLVTLLLAGGLAISGGTAGVIAAGGNGGGKNATESQYQDGKCNSGNGNGSDAVTFVDGEHCYGGDPGNSYNAGNKGGDEIPTSNGNPNPGGNNVP